MKVRYAFQELENLPEGFEVPAGRVKPWGTAHAILSCKDMIDGPFAVIMQTTIMEEKHLSRFMII